MRQVPTHKLQLHNYNPKWNQEYEEEKELNEELEKNGVIILNDEIKEINDYIYLIGRDDKSNKNRKTIDELVKNLNKDRYLILLDHQPNDYDNEMNKVDLVLSGHSHGGQIFPLGYIGLLLKQNDEFYGLHKEETLILSLIPVFQIGKSTLKLGHALNIIL